MAPNKDWAFEMAQNGNMPSNDREVKDMIAQMDRLGLKGAYNPKNHFPGSLFMPSAFPSPKEVQEKAERLSQKVLSDWDTLQKIAERHHVVIEKRWLKRTRTKQKDLLKLAWTNMWPTHRPDFETYRQENTGSRQKGFSKYLEAYLW